MPLRVSSPTFVGREAQLEALVAALDRAAQGEPAFVLVAGESGVGKSRLVAELQEHARESGARVLSGDCVEVGEGNLPYAPLLGALRPLAQELGAAELSELVGPAAGELAPLLPELAMEDAAHGTPSHPSVPELAQSRLYELLLLLLRRLGEQAPVLLVIEDLHWADAATRHFLSFLIPNIRSERLALVITYRSDELHRRHPLRPFLAEADREPRVERVELARFDRAELTQQLAGILDEPPDPGLVDRLFERSEGNPFFAEELLSASVEGVDGLLPDTLRDALMVRVESLSPTSVMVLQVAAAAGRQVSHRLLVRAGGFDEGELNQSLREAVTHHVLVQRPGEAAFAFRHALLREAVYEDLLPGERSGLHLTLAQTLSKEPDLSASRGSAAAELAWHWYQAHDLAAALAASVEAGLQAERVYASREAVRHFENAIDLWERVPEEQRPSTTTLPDLLECAAEAVYRTGQYDRAIAMADRALEARRKAGSSSTEIALLLERRGRYLWSESRTEEALVSYHDAVLEMPEDPPTAERARVLGAEAQILMLTGRAEQSRPLAEEAIRIAREVGAREEEGHGINTLAVDLVVQEADWDSAIELLREALDIAYEVSSAQDICRAHVNLGDTLDQAGRTEEAVEVAFEGLRLADEFGYGLSYAAFMAAEACDRLIRLGRWEEADQLLADALSRPLTGMTGGHALQERAMLDIRLGDFDAARAWLQESLGKHSSKPGSMWIGPIYASFAELALWTGELEDAWTAFEQYLDSLSREEEYGFYVLRLYTAALQAQAGLAERARALGDADAERLALSRAEQVMERAQTLIANTSMMSRAYLDICRAELARTTDAWDIAIESSEAVRDPFQTAMSRWRRAELLLAAGDRAAAAADLAAARILAAELKARPLLGEIEGLARRARLDLGGEQESEPETVAADGNGELTEPAERLGLTARELDVLRLVAEGLTNREIAGRLYISDKTASVHVSRILAKLDVRSRVEAAGVAHRLGISD